MPVQFPQYNYLNYGQAIEQGNRNALTQAHLGQAAQQQREYNALAPQRAQKRDIDLMLQKIEAAEKRSKLVTDENSFQSYRQWGISNGIFNDNEIPKTYDPVFIDRMQGMLAKGKEHYGPMQEIPGMAGWYGQKELGSGKMANLHNTKSLKGEGESSGLKAADENAIFKYSAAQFDAFYDPTTGEFKGLKGEDKQKAQSLAAMASRLFVESNGQLSRLEAVSEAGRRMGINIEDLSKTVDKPTPGGKTKIMVDPRTGARYEVDENKQVIREVR